MTNCIRIHLKHDQIKKGLVSKKRIPAFRSGDTIRVNLLKSLKERRSRLAGF